MASGIWVSDLVAHGKGVAPRVYVLVQALPEPRPRVAWSTTSALSARPRAVGAIVEATAQQIADLHGVAQVWARELLANWRTVTWGTVPANVRNKVTTVLGVSPGIANSDLLPVAMDKILGALDDGTIRSLADLEAALGQAL